MEELSCLLDFECCVCSIQAKCLSCYSMEYIFKLAEDIDKISVCSVFLLTASVLMMFSSSFKLIILTVISTVKMLLWNKFCKNQAKKAHSKGPKDRARVDAAQDKSQEETKSSSGDSGVESGPDTPEKALPEIPEPLKKSTRRQRKKRNPNKSKIKSMMDDSSETSSTSDLSTKSDVQPEKTVIYTPLNLYLELTLNMNMYDLYHEFRHYLLTRDQLKLYGFPEESPDHPGRAILRTTQSVARGSTERRCCRCGGVFNIQPDGRYVSDTACRYHTRKQLPFRGGPYHGDFPCCNGNYLSQGCKTWQYHVTAESALHDVEFRKTKSKRHLNEVTAGTVYALDCEMLYTTAGMEVAKVGIVSMEGLTIFESFVLPENQILDYNTVYSGVTEKDLKGVKMTLGDVQTYLLKLLNNESILVGHGLENDLKALRLIHTKIVDTSVVFPFEHSKVYKKSLRNLAHEILSKQIQESDKGHNCIEDARTCMELMLHKIKLDLNERPPVTQDENKNSILQNTSSQPAEYTPAKYGSVFQPWPYSCNFTYCSDSYRNNFYSGFIMPKNYNNCIYG